MGSRSPESTRDIFATKEPFLTGTVFLVLLVTALILTIAITDPSTAQPRVDICVSPLPFPPYLVFPDLEKPVSGGTSRYAVTNEGFAWGSTYHSFCSADHTLVAEILDGIDLGATNIYDLADIAGLPSGYQGYVVVTASQAITGVLLSPLPTPAPTPTPTPELIYLPLVQRD